MRPLPELGHERCADLVDTNQVCTKIVEADNHLKHEPALTSLFVVKPILHAWKTYLEGTNPPLRDLTHRRRLVKDDCL